MSPKQLIILSLSVIMLLLLSVLGFFLVYDYDPRLLGFPPRPEDTAQVVRQETLPQYEVESEPTVQLTREEMDAFQADALQKSLLLTQRDSLLKSNIFIFDTLNKLQFFVKHFNDSLSKVKDSLGKSLKFQLALYDSLGKYQRLYKGAMSETKSTKEQLKLFEKSIEKKYDSLDEKNFREFAKIYNNSSPQEVARILQQIDEKDAAMILKYMNVKKAGKVLEAMKPENAAAILLLGSQK